MNEEEYKKRKNKLDWNIKYHENQARIFKEDLSFLEERYSHENKNGDVL
jgi:hypothetical protein